MKLIQRTCRRADMQPLLLIVLVFALLPYRTVALSLTNESTAEKIFDLGKYETQKFRVQGSDSWWKDLWDLGVPTCHKKSSAPGPQGEKPARELLITVPNCSGEYPVVQFHHGFTLETDYYTQLMAHIASHGYIVVAPQMAGDISQFLRTDDSDEISYAAAIVDWYPMNLAENIRKNVAPFRIEPNLNKLVLVAHSRGGKTAFGLATEFCKASLKYSAIVGLDPVDGLVANIPLKPQVLPYQPQSLHLKYPTMIIGAALGPIGLLLLPPCAPEGVNHEVFYNDSSPPALHFVAENYGHMDYLDDSIWTVSTSVCKSGVSRAPMRRFSGGMTVGFLQAVLFNDNQAFDYYVQNPLKVPDVTLQTAEENGWFDSRYSEL